MKNIFQYPFILICLFCNINLLKAQWVKTSSPTVGIYGFAASDTNLFIGTSGLGVYRSTKNGTTWNSVNLGLKSTSINRLAVMDKNLFAGCWNNLDPEIWTDGIYISTNNGMNWIADTTGFGDNSVTAFAVGDYPNIFVGTAWNPRTKQQGGVYRSTDKGNSWTLIIFGLATSGQFEIL